jgi:hypothetical protein
MPSRQISSRTGWPGSETGPKSSRWREKSSSRAESQSKNSPLTMALAPEMLETLMITLPLMAHWR